MSKVHKTAAGKILDMDVMKLANENTIAIGNMHTNARGDELSQGGKVSKTRSEIMQDYYGLTSPVADDSPLTIKKSAPKIQTTNIQYELPPAIPNGKKILEDNLDSEVESTYTKPRGSLADTVAQTTEVTQTLLTPPGKKQKDNGIQRI